MQLANLNITYLYVEFTFTAHRNRRIFQNDCVTGSDEKNVRLLLQNLEPTEHEKYGIYILPKKTKNE